MSDGQNWLLSFIGGAAVGATAYYFLEQGIGTGGLPGLPSNTHNVSLNASGDGTVIGAGAYQAGKPVQITAIPNPGSSFSNWIGSYASSENPFSFTMPDQNVAVTANFSSAPSNTYNVYLHVSPAGAGTVIGAGAYQAGEQVQIIATPNSGHSFINWSLTNSGTSWANPFTFTMPARHVVLTANFSGAPPDSYHVYLYTSPHVGGIALYEGLYQAGEQVQITAIPNPGYVFKNWTSSYTSNDNPFSFTMPAGNVWLHANFMTTQGEYTLDVGMFTGGTTTNDPGGYVEIAVGDDPIQICEAPATGGHCYYLLPPGAVVGLHAVPLQNFWFVGWYDPNCEGTYSYCTITMNDNKEALAVFST